MLRDDELPKTGTGIGAEDLPPTGLGPGIPERAEQPPLRLALLCKPGRGLCYEPVGRGVYGRAFLINRGEEAARPERLSARHFEIEEAPLRIKDLGSTFGLWINGHRLEPQGWYLLQEGDAVQAGDRTFGVAAPPQAAAVKDAAGLVWSAPGMDDLIAKLAKLAQAPMPVLLLGEPGVGKEGLARLYHEKTGRTGPFIALNCATLSPALVDAELFGHTKNAFTNAQKERPGAFREAAGGTVFLDEIGTLPLDQQSKLLRVLQERTVKPVGADREEAVDVALVSATNADLEVMAQGGGFRSDLLFRLGVRLRVPPLRARREDIPALAAAFAGDRPLPPGLLGFLSHLFWEGNVRSLKQMIETARVLHPQIGEPRDLFPNPMNADELRALIHGPSPRVPSLSGAGAVAPTAQAPGARLTGADPGSTAAQSLHGYLKLVRALGYNWSAVLRTLGGGRKQGPNVTWFGTDAPQIRANIAARLLAPADDAALEAYLGNLRSGRGKGIARAYAEDEITQLVREVQARLDDA